MGIQRILKHRLVLSSLTDEQIFHNNAIYDFYYHSWTIVHRFFFFFWNYMYKDVLIARYLAWSS